MTNANGFWKHRRVTVTGGAGFLGSCVTQKLNDLRANVFVPRSRKYDLTQADQTQRMYGDATPQVLIHLAARVGGIGIIRDNPARYFLENMAIGLNVIEEGRRYGELEKLVVIGTVCSYPKSTPVPFREENIWDGYPEETNAPYGVAKRALLSMSWSYRQQHGMNVIYLIPANLYGPRDNFDVESSHVVPALVRKFTEARNDALADVSIWGTGSASREFLYVEDAAEGIVLATEHYSGADPVNLGNGREVRIKELAETISHLTGYTGRVVWDASKPDGQPRRQLDTSRASSEFGFKASTSLESGLRRTIEWYESQVVETEG